MKINWTGFSKKTPAERLQILKEKGLLQDEHWQLLDSQQTLPLETANQMSENVLATLALPYSLVPDFLVDGKTYQVPFVTEEPSVVAAASFAAKIIKRSGGFETEVHKRQMIGQIALYQVDNADQAIKDVLRKKKELLEQANQAYPSIVARGGGARDLWLEQKDDFLIFYLSVDTQEAMGANMLNTILEALVSPIEALTGGESIMAILSNLATNSVVTARCVLSPRILDTRTTKGEDVIDRIVLASEFSKADPYRATTHNKGIMNGIDSIVIATGNDWRAIEAGAHVFASLSGQYQPLTSWTKDEAGNLVGTITLPLPVGTVGGSISIHPGAQFAHELLGHPSAIELAGIIASIGLAQNLAAVRALVTDGIQKGHMRLQAKSLGLAVGATEEELPLLMNLLAKAPHLNQETAKALLEELRK